MMLKILYKIKKHKWMQPFKMFIIKCFLRPYNKLRTNFIVPKFHHNCAQGDDIILLPYVPPKGFYVDIGAYHPKKYSVTRIFYGNKWRGMNIEPNPHQFKKFKRLRKRDINLNIGISNQPGELNYFFWGKDDTTNTFDVNLYEKWRKNHKNDATIIKIQVDTINNILDNYLPYNTKIDFLTIDVEGFELKILQSLDYDKYSPSLILVEELDYWDRNKDFMDFKEMELYIFLKSKGYIVAAKTWYTILFKKNE